MGLGGGEMAFSFFYIIGIVIINAMVVLCIGLIARSYTLKKRAQDARNTQNTQNKGSENIVHRRTRSSITLDLNDFTREEVKEILDLVETIKKRRA